MSQPRFDPAQNPLGEQTPMAAPLALDAGAPPPEIPNEEHFNTEHLLKDLRGHTISSGAITAISQGAQFILNLLSTMVLTRLLLPADFGVVAMVLTVMGFLRVFKDAGLSTATVQQEGITHAQVSNLFWINVAVSGAISLILAASSPLIAWFFHEPRLIKITLVLSATFLVSGLTVQHMAILNRQMRFKVICLIQITALIVSVMVGIGMAWFKYGYWSLVGLQITTPVVACILTWAVSRWRPQLPVKSSGTRPLLHFGANLAASGFVWSIARGSDGLLIGRFCGAGPVGVYTRAAALLIRPLELALSPLESVFVPALSRLQSDPERYRRAFLQAYEAIAVGGFLFGGFLFALARPLTLVILGPKFAAAAVIFAAFTICMLYIPLSTAATWLFTSQGRGRDALRCASIVSVLVVGAFTAGLPFGAAGVATAYSTSGVLIQLPVVFYLAGREGPITRKDLWVSYFKHVPVWLVVWGTTYLVLATMPNRTPLSQVLVCAPIGLLTGAVFLFLYPPSRGAAFNFLKALRNWQTGGK